MLGVSRAAIFRVAEIAVPLAIFALIISGMWWLETSEFGAFKKQCLAIPKSEAECDLLVSIKRSSDAAAMTAAFTVGFTAARLRTGR